MTEMRHDHINYIAQALYDKKGFNILAIDVLGISTLTDFFVIAEGTSDRHVRAMGQNVVEKLREKGLRPLHVEGESDGDWLVLDYGDFVIHIFMPGLREKYSLEALWHEGKIVDVTIDISSQK